MHHGRAFGAGRLVEWRMRRACSRFEAWGARPRSRFAARSANCLKVAQRRGGAGARKKNCSVWQLAVVYSHDDKHSLYRTFLTALEERWKVEDEGELTDLLGMA